jgi:hypothetical protein
MIHDFPQIAVCVQRGPQVPTEAVPPSQTNIDSVVTLDGLE